MKAEYRILYDGYHYAIEKRWYWLWFRGWTRFATLSETLREAEQRIAKHSATFQVVKETMTAK